MKKSLLILFSLVFISACSMVEKSTTNPIVCKAFYRSSPGESLDSAPLIRFTGGNDEHHQNFGNMAFSARFQDDDYEGRALSIAITNLETGDEISRQLYQFDSANPVENQFVGGHGFTGLNYVFSPDSGAEIQYFCLVE